MRSDRFCYCFCAYNYGECVCIHWKSIMLLLSIVKVIMIVVYTAGASNGTMRVLCNRKLCYSFD